jgi:hypothetical protein
MYQAAKLFMNGLSGKFGQKLHAEISKVMLTLPPDPDSFFGSDMSDVTWELIERLKQLDDGDDNEDPVAGYFVQGNKPDADVKVSYPIQMSVWILAYARRTMSKAMRCVNGYFMEEHCFMYTDTDSLVVRKSTFDILQQNGYIGSKLGMLEDEFPNDYLVAARFLAPKNYVLMMLKKVSQDALGNPKFSLAYKVRCKVSSWR